MELSITEELIFGAQPGFLTLSAAKSQELVAQQPLDQNYSVDNQPFARGKFAAVKRCRHLDSGRELAAKVIRKRRRGAGLSAETLHEAAVLDLCRSCPHIVRLEQVYDAPTESVLVLELAEGGELQSILDRDEIPEESHVIRFLRQVLSGLAFLHKRDIAHLDLKPQNLLLTGSFPDCDIKLCDFGIARHIARGADVREILGTPDYVAPEVLNYEPISLATDMWSVGVLAYVLLTGCTPFGGDTKQETFCNITRCQLDFPEDIFANVSSAAIQFISSLLVKDPAGRLTAAQCLEHPWLSCGSSVDSIPAIMSMSDESCAFSSSSTIVPEDDDIHDDERLEDIDAGVTPEEANSDTTDTVATVGVTSSKLFLDDTLMIPLPFANMSLTRRTASLPIRWRCPAKRDPAYDRASDLGYGSDGISEVSSVDSSSDRSSIISLDDSPLEYAVMRRFSDTSLSGERLWRRAWERFLPASAGTFVSPPHLLYRTQGPKSEMAIRGRISDPAGRMVNKPWERVCNGSLARAMERFKTPSSPTACPSAAMRPSPKVSEVRSKLLQVSPSSPKSSPQKTPILHREKSDIVKTRLSKFQANSTTP